MPQSFVIGDETTTEVNGITYVNGRLRQGRQYAVFYRVEIVSNNAAVIWVAVIYIFTFVVNSEYVISRTGMAVVT